MKSEEMKKLERHLVEDFEAVSPDIQTYLIEEMLEPEEVLCGDYNVMSIAKRTELVNRAIVRVTANCFDNDYLLKSQMYLESVSEYFLHLANANVERELARK